MNFDFKRFFVRLYEKAFDEDIFNRAAQVAFYFIFAIFPLLLFLISIFGLVMGSVDNLRNELFIYLKQIMPVSAFNLVEKTLAEVVKNSSGEKLTLGFLIALWSASAGLDSISLGLNGVYKLVETRPWWKRKLISVILTLAISLLAFIGLGIMFYVPHSILFADLPPIILSLFSFGVLLSILSIVFALIYSFSPDHSPFSWKWISPGAITAIILWLSLSAGFRFYLAYFDSYEMTYGSLGALIILVLWLYLTALVILTGGAINAILDEFSKGKFYKSQAHIHEAADEKINS